ncbi:MAG: HAMP domain-containing histidine kinase [Ignavibacteriales bacterium]|nr:MAG: HAMP domain-containing histidine kinase [Ignavibacteriales bacterium]
MINRTLIQRYKSFVFGESTEFDVQKNIFLLITHISLIIAFVGIITNIVMGLALSLTLVTVAAFFIVVYFHFYVRNNGLGTNFSLGFFGVTVIVFSYLWFYNGGYNGNNSVLIFVYFIVVITVLPQRFRMISFIVYSVMIVGLITLQYFNPVLVIPYENQEQRFIDLAIGYFLYLILAYNIQNTILKNYDAERIKGKKINRQLSELNQQVNETNKKLEESIKSVEELNASKDRFITILSHDLRSPFHGLLGLSRILKEEYDTFPEMERKYIIHQLNNSIETLYSFLEEILLWGRLQRGVVKPKYSDENILNLFEEILNVHKQSLSKKAIQTVINCDKDLSALIDKELLSVVLRNLVSNAIKFSLSGKSIELNAFKESGTLKIEVSDKGIGITEKNLSRLFKIDEIVTTKGTEGETGSGMGLILCMDILKKLEGKISVHTVEGEGSVFTVELPKQILN